MNGLKHAGVAPLRVNVAGGCNAQAASQRGGQIAQDIGMQIGRDQRIERGRAVDHTGGAGINQFLVPGDVGELFADLNSDFVPHHHGVTLGI